MGFLCFILILFANCFSDFLEPVCETLKNVYVCKHAISCRWESSGCQNDTACFKSGRGSQISNCNLGCKFEDGEFPLCYNSTYHVNYGGEDSDSYAHWATSQNDHCQSRGSTYGTNVCMEAGLKNDEFLNPVCSSLKNENICKYAISCRWGSSGCVNDTACFKYDGTDSISCNDGCTLDQDGDGYMCFNSTYHSDYGKKGSCSYTHWATSQNNHCQGHGGQCATYGEGVCLESGLSNDPRWGAGNAFGVSVPSLVTLVALALILVMN